MLHSSLRIPRLRKENTVAPSRYLGPIVTSFLGKKLVGRKEQHLSLTVHKKVILPQQLQLIIPQRLPNHRHVLTAPSPHLPLVHLLQQISELELLLYITRQSQVEISTQQDNLRASEEPRLVGLPVEVGVQLVEIVKPQETVGVARLEPTVYQADYAVVGLEEEGKSAV
jgi:hypothetical protein